MSLRSRDQPLVEGELEKALVLTSVAEPAVQVPNTKTAIFWDLHGNKWSIIMEMFPGPFSTCHFLLQSLQLLTRQLRRQTFWLGRLEKCLPISFCCFVLAKTKLSETQGWDHFQESLFPHVWETGLAFHLHDSQLNRYLSLELPF